MARITVTSDELRQQTLKVNQGHTEVEGTLRQLTGQIQNLAASWEGAASQAFQDRWQDWNRGTEQVLHAMTEMGAFLTRAAEAYETTEDQLHSAASQ